MPHSPAGLERVFAVLRTLSGENAVLPPTELYNEGWLLCIILQWFGSHLAPGAPLSFAEGARWYSEARLPTPFGPRFQQDPLGEARSHADGVIGHFAIGGGTKAGLTLSPDATCFKVLEAKHFSGLSAGVKHSPHYNQAARSVACTVEAMRLAARPPEAFSELAFYVFLPAAQLQAGTVAQSLDPAAIDAGVHARVQAYGGEKDQWYGNWFKPALGRMTIAALTWEDVLGEIRQYDGAAADDVQASYALCLQFNG